MPTRSRLDSRLSRTWRPVASGRDTAQQDGEAALQDAVQPQDLKSPSPLAPTRLHIVSGRGFNRSSVHSKWMAAVPHSRRHDWQAPATKTTQHPGGEINGASCRSSSQLGQRGACGTLVMGRHANVSGRECLSHQCPKPSKAAGLGVTAAKVEKKQNEHEEISVQDDTSKRSLATSVLGEIANLTSTPSTGFELSTGDEYIEAVSVPRLLDAETTQCSGTVDFLNGKRIAEEFRQVKDQFTEISSASSSLSTHEPVEKGCENNTRETSHSSTVLRLYSECVAVAAELQPVSPSSLPWSHGLGSVSRAEREGAHSPAIAKKYPIGESSKLDKVGGKALPLTKHVRSRPVSPSPLPWSHFALGASKKVIRKPKAEAAAEHSAIVESPAAITGEKENISSMKSEEKPLPASRTCLLPDNRNLPGENMDPLRHDGGHEAFPLVPPTTAPDVSIAAMERRQPHLSDKPVKAAAKGWSSEKAFGGTPDAFTAPSAGADKLLIGELDRKVDVTKEHEEPVAEPANQDRDFADHYSLRSTSTWHLNYTPSPSASSCHASGKLRVVIGAGGDGVASSMTLLRSVLRAAEERTRGQEAMAKHIIGSVDSNKKISTRIVALRCAENEDDLATRVREFLASQRKVFLLIGEAGSGKSSFATSLARDLISDFESVGFIPVIMDARETEGPRGAPLDGLLEYFFTTSLKLGKHDLEVVRKKQRLLIIFDGFEMIPRSERRNLWVSNAWARWRVKVLLTLRPSGLERSSKQPPEELFVPTDPTGLKLYWQLETATIGPFKPDQVEDFLGGTGNNSKPPARSLHSLAGLHVLGSHPLTLNMAWEAAEGGRESRRTKNSSTLTGWESEFTHDLTRARIMSCWFKWIIQSQQGIARDKTKRVGLKAAEDFAFSLYQAGRWTTETIPDGNGQTLLRQLLVPIGQTNLYGFARSSLLEYLVAAHIRRSVLEEGHAGHGASQSEGGSTSSIMSKLAFGCKSVNRNGHHTGESLVLVYLGEICSADVTFAALLYDMVSESKKLRRKITKGDSRYRDAVKIPGAILDGGVFDGCSFYHANLTGCSFRNTSLRCCKFQKAKLRDVDIGALPELRPFAQGIDKGNGPAEGVARAEVSADGAVVIILAGDGRSAKVLETAYFQEIYCFLPGEGRLFLPDLLMLSPDSNFFLVYSVDDPAIMERFCLPQEKRLELRVLQEASRAPIFDGAAVTGSVDPAFYPDSTRFVHQHEKNVILVVECSSGETVGAIRLNLPRKGEESGKKDTLDNEGAEDPKREAQHKGSSTAFVPKICSLRVTPDQAKIQVGLTWYEDVILEYETSDWDNWDDYESGCLSTDNAAVTGRRIVATPTVNNGGLYAVLGPDRDVQIWSWQIISSHQDAAKDQSRETNGIAKPARGETTVMERELARLRCGGEEMIEELVFASTGEFFLARDSQGATASLWSIKPDIAPVQWMKEVSCFLSSNLFVASGKAVALSHSDCTVKVYSCENGKVLLSHDVTSPTIWLAIIRGAATVGINNSHVGESILVAFTESGKIYRWYLPAWVSLGSYATEQRPCIPVSGYVRNVAALPMATSHDSPGASGCGGHDRRQRFLFTGDRGMIALDAMGGVRLQDTACHLGGRGVSHVAITPDGKTIVSVGDDNELLEWDAYTLAPKNKRTLGSEVRALAISPDSALIATLTLDGVCVHKVGGTLTTSEEANASANADTLSQLPASSLGTISYQFAPQDVPTQISFWDSQSLAVAHSRGKIQLWSVGAYHQKNEEGPGITSSSIFATSASVTAEWIAHDGLITCMAAHPQPTRDASTPDAGDTSATVGDGAYVDTSFVGKFSALATGGGDGKVHIWSDEGMAISRSVEEVIVAETNGGGRKASAISRSIRRGTGHEGAVLCVCWHPDGEVLASAGQDWAIWLWNSQGRALSYVHAYQRCTEALTFSTSGEFLASCGATGFAGWSVAVTERSQAFTLCWRHPRALIATEAELDGATELSVADVQTLRDHGAAPMFNNNQVNHDSAKKTVKLTAMAGFKSALPPMLTVIGADGVDGDWTVDGVKSLAWPDDSDDLMARDYEEMTVLHHAARHGRGYLVDSLIESGADIEAEDVRGFTPLCWAASCGYSTIVRALLFSVAVKNGDGVLEAAGADPDHVTCSGDTPAILAAREGHLCAMVELERGGADLGKANAAGETPLIVASYSGRVEVVAFLASITEIDLDRRSAIEGNTALAVAAFLGHTECMRVLVARGADPLVPTTDGRSPTFLAASGGHLATLRLLLDVVGSNRWTEISRPDSSGRTPAMAASANGHLECLRALVQDGNVGDKESTGETTVDFDVDKVNIQDIEGRTALMYACMYDQPQCAAFLLSSHAHLDAGDKAGVTSLMLAAGRGHDACAQVLLAASTTFSAENDCAKRKLVDATDVDGNCASHFACKAGAAGVLALVSEAGASMELPSGIAETGRSLCPAHLAVTHGSLLCLEQLATRGVNLEATDGESDTVLSLAVKCGRKSCVEYLLSGGVPDGDPLVDVDRPGRREERPLSVAVRCGKLQILFLLLQAGADLAAKNCDGETAMHVAARYGQVAAVKVLAQAGHARGKNATDKEQTSLQERLSPVWQMTTNADETATFIAASNGHAAVCRALYEVGALDPKPPNVDGITPMMVASLSGNIEVIQVLIEGGGDLNHPDEAGRTPVMAAALRGDISMLEFLVKNNADLSIQNSDGRTAAFFAAMSGNVDCLLFTLDGELPALAGAPATCDVPDKIGCTPLWTAAAHGHLEVVRHLIARGALPGVCDVTGTSAAWMAAGGGNTKCLKALLGAGADGDLANEDGVSPTLIAAQEGYVSCLRVLHEAGADLQFRDLGGNSAVALAAMGGHLTCLKLLSASGVDMDVPNNDGHSPVFAAITHGRLDCLHELAAVGANLLRRDHASGNTPVMVAASHGQTSCLRYIVDRAGRHLLEERNKDGLSSACFAVICGREETLAAIGELDPSLFLDRDQTGRSIPHYAAVEGNVGCLRVVAGICAEAFTAASKGGASKLMAGLRHWGRFRSQQYTFAACLDAQGDSPLHAAARAGKIDAFTYLVSEAGLRPEDSNAHGETCLWLAAAYDRVELLRLLVEQGLNVNAADHEGRSPAHVVAFNNYTDALKVLVGTSGNSFLDLNSRDKEGATPLHYAVVVGHLEIVSLLADAGADLDATDSSGRTPAWIATADGEAATLRLLASKGAMLDRRTQTGATLSHTAACDGSFRCLEALCELGSEVDVANQMDNTSVMFAAMAGDLNYVRVLAQRGCDLSKRDRQHNTPAFLAAQEGHSECLALLLSLGADGGVARADGATPLIIAAQNGHRSCVKILLSPPTVEPLSHVPLCEDYRLNRTGIVTDGGSWRAKPVPAAPLTGIEDRTSNGYTALCMAVVAGEKQCVEDLLSMGANVHTTDRKGRSPLHLAAATGDSRMCGLLLAHGAQPQLKTNDGVNPAIAAALCGHASVARTIARAAHLDPGSIFDPDGVSLSEYLTRCTTKSTSSDVFKDLKGYGNSFKYVVALLPASVARLPPAVASQSTVIPSALSTGNTGSTSGMSNISDLSNRNEYVILTGTSAATSYASPAPAKSLPTFSPKRHNIRRSGIASQFVGINMFLSKEGLTSGPVETVGRMSSPESPILRPPCSGRHARGRTMAATFDTPCRRRPHPTLQENIERADGKSAATKMTVHMAHHLKKETIVKQLEVPETLLDGMAAVLFDMK